MGLELRIIKDPCRDVPKPRFRSFGEQGGDIGRAPDRYWVLPDPKGYVSAQHCSILYRDGTFWLRDTSRNGVYVNGSRDPIGNGNEAQLRHGDRLRLAEYEVLVRLYPRSVDSGPQSPEVRDTGASGTWAAPAPPDYTDTGEHDLKPGDVAGGSGPLRDDTGPSVATATLVTRAAKPEATGADWTHEARADAANDSAGEAPSSAGLAPASTAQRADESSTVATEGAGREQFKPASLDQPTMERNRVLLSLYDARALSAYKILRTRVRRRMIASQWRSIGVCGAAEGAGKTLTAINLAATFAQDARSPAVLVDVDLSRPNVAAYLGMKCDKGLTDYLLGEAEIGDIVYSPGVKGLAIVPNVRPLQNASELLASPRMTQFVKYLESLQPQRTILFDLPPLLMSDDVLLFAPHMDCVLDVVAVGITPRASLERSKEILAEFNVVGVVLNRATSQDKTSHYYY